LPAQTRTAPGVLCRLFLRHRACFDDSEADVFTPRRCWRKISASESVAGDRDDVAPQGLVAGDGGKSKSNMETTVEKRGQNMGTRWGHHGVEYLTSASLYRETRRTDLQYLLTKPMAVSSWSCDDSMWRLSTFSTPFVIQIVSRERSRHF
jgi:hypothetical protein